MPPSFAEQITVEKVGHDDYLSKCLPGKMGNTAPIAYGGCTLAAAVHAACLSVKPSYSLYSVLGHYLGPASTDQKLRCRVYPHRDTRSFATRRVEVYQLQADEKERLCLTLLADFQVVGPSLLTYSAAPRGRYSNVDDCPTGAKLAEDLVAKGRITRGQARMREVLFGFGESFFESRFCPEGVSGQNLAGVAKQLDTTQDHLPITSKSSAEWYRTRQPLSSSAEQLAGLSFLMDGALSFLPLFHDHKSLDDAGACSSLDFALRVFSNDFDLNTWHLREGTTTNASAGLTYSEALLWDRSGKMIASMTQHSILRPKPNAGAKL